MNRNFGWLAILRLGLVQASLGGVVVLTTSTLNRVMVVELSLPAILPGILVAMHYVVQIARPRMGHGSDMGHRRTPWIVGGMIVLATGGVLAAIATAWIGSQPVAGFVLALVAFILIGLGVSASGTSLLVLLAKRVEAERRATAATLIWLMMIVGFAITAGVAGQLLDPFSPMRLIGVATGVSVLAVTVTMIATRGLEGPGTPAPAHALAGSEPALRFASLGAGRSMGAEAAMGDEKPSFRLALAQVWAEPVARLFTVFVFVSMLAYSAQDLILEPFAGTVLGFTPGESTSLSGTQHAGVLLGMIAAALAGRGPKGKRFGSLCTWQVGGCLLSALMLLGVASAGLVGSAWPFKATVFGLGVANGAFAIAAIASMMRFAAEGRQGREGVRMGLWGAAQALAFGAGGLAGAAASDLARWLIAQPGLAYASVFAAEALLFVAAAVLAVRVGRASGQLARPTLSVADREPMVAAGAASR